MNLLKNISTIREELNKPYFSGVCSIRKKSEIILESCHGYLDWANQIPVKMNTRFGIASGTKLFTALGIMRLVENKACSLDDDIFQYINHRFPTYDQNITIKHLLTHTSGIPDYLNEENVNDQGLFSMDIPWYKLKKPSDYLTILPQKDMVFKPGSKFVYNDSAFILLAVIIEKITGDYYHWIEKEILEKAGMDDSGFFMLNKLPKNTAYGYKNVREKPYETNVYDLPIIGGGDGGMFATTDDMNRFWDSFINGRIVTEKTVQLMMKPHAKGEAYFYGLGLWLQEDEGVFVPLILGEDCGVSFESGFHPKSQITYTIISNTQDGVWPMSKLID